MSVKRENKSEHDYSLPQIDGKTIWQWVGSHHSTGYPLMLCLLVYPVFIGSFQSPPPELAVELNYHVLDFLGGFGAACGVMLLRAFAGRLKSGNRKTFLVVFGWYLAGVLGSALQYAAASWAGPAPEIYARLIPVGGVTICGLAFCFTIVSSVVRRNRDAFQDLARATQNLEFLNQTTELRITESKNATYSKVKATLVPLIESLSEAIEKLSNLETLDTKQKTLEMLRQSTLNVIRPLSHELHQTETDLKLDDPVSRLRRPAKATLALLASRPMNLNVVFNGYIPPILLVAFFGSAYFVVGGWQAFFGGALFGTTLVALALVFLNRLLAKIRLSAFIVFALGITSGLVLTSVYRAVPEVLNFGIEDDFLDYIAMGAGLVLTTTVIITFLYDSWLFALTYERKANEEKAAILARSRQELWHWQKQLAKVIHGNVQSKLNAAQIRLSRESALTPQLIQSVLSDLEVSLEKLNVFPQKEDIDILLQLSELEDLWQNICQVSYSLNENAIDSVLQDASAAQTVVEVISEGISNAVKHANATSISILLNQHNRSSVTVEIRHRSSQSKQKSSTSGLGTEILNQLALSWSRSSVEDETVLRAEIPVSTQQIQL